MAHVFYCWKLDGSGGAVPGELSEWNGPELIWVHLDFGDEETERWLLEESGLDPVIAEALVAEEPRPRVVAKEDGLLIQLRGVNTNAGDDPEDMVSLRMWIEAGRICTVRRRRLTTVRLIRESLEAGDGPKNAGDFLVDVVDGLNERISDCVMEVEESLDALEATVLEQQTQQLRSQLSDLRRQSIALRRYLAPQREAVGRLHTERADWLDELQRARLREGADRLVRCLEDLDAIRERAAVTQEEVVNQLTEQMNRTMYILSLVAAIFLPLGLVTGLFGINVGGMPWTEEPFGFALVTGSLVAMALGLWGWFRYLRLL